MTYWQIAQAVKAVAERCALPVTYYQWPKGATTNPEPPYLVYWMQDRDDFYADNSNYQRVAVVRLELYTPDKDPRLEEALEKALGERVMSYERAGEEYIDSEEMFMVVYTWETLLDWSVG